MPREKVGSDEEASFSEKNGMVGKIIFAVLFVILLSGFVWYYMQYQKAQQQLISLSSVQGQQELNQEEIDKILEGVSKHILLPTEEVPTIATIEDAAALAAQQNFFKDAQNGDKVLIFSDRAIIYSPDRDLLVNVGPVYFQEGQGENIPTEQPAEEETAEETAETLSLDIRNGSSETGKASGLAGSLGAEEGTYAVTSITNAVNTDYSGVTLVNLTGKDVSVLEQQLGVTAVTVLPEGEAGSASDVVIIVGN